MALRERDAIRDVRLLAVSLVVLAAVTVAFVLHSVLHLEPSVVALVGGLVLLAGLFVMVGALVNTGVVDVLARGAADAPEGRLVLASGVLLWASAGGERTAQPVGRQGRAGDHQGRVAAVHRARRGTRCAD